MGLLNDGQVYTSLCRNQSLPKARHASIRTLAHPSEPQTILDASALVLSFPAPRTVTGEDVLELHVHGGTAIVSSILAAIATLSTKFSLRYAEPGEFTRRAFYNDRLDLTQVEALGSSLDAVTEEQRRVSVQGSRNGLGNTYENWRQMLLYARGELEALIDFSEDQHFDESSSDLAQSVALQIQELIEKIELHKVNAMRGELLRNGIRVSLLGSPNAGKSSILNRIVGRNAAIVSQEAGTTRDVVEVGIDLGGFLCRLGDTAGLRKALGDIDPLTTTEKPVGEIEQEGIRRARVQAEQSDVIIVVLPLVTSPPDAHASLNLDPEVVSTANGLAEQGKRLVIAINKVDLLHSAPTAGTDALSTSAGTLTKVTREDELAATVRRAIPSTLQKPIYFVSCTSAQANDVTHGRRDGTVTSSPPPSRPSTSDLGNFGRFVSGLIDTFRELTVALHPPEEEEGTRTSNNEADKALARGTSIWEDSLGATARQAHLLDTCHVELTRFLNLVGSANKQLSEASSISPPTTTTAIASPTSADGPAQHVRYPDSPDRQQHPSHSTVFNSPAHSHAHLHDMQQAGSTSDTGRSTSNPSISSASAATSTHTHKRSPTPALAPGTAPSPSRGAHAHPPPTPHTNGDNSAPPTRAACRTDADAEADAEADADAHAHAWQRGLGPAPAAAVEVDTAPGLDIRPLRAHGHMRTARTPPTNARVMRDPTSTPAVDTQRRAGGSGGSSDVHGIRGMPSFFPRQGVGDDESDGSSNSTRSLWDAAKEGALRKGSVSGGRQVDGARDGDEEEGVGAQQPIRAMDERSLDEADHVVLPQDEGGNGGSGDGGDEIDIVAAAEHLRAAAAALGKITGKGDEGDVEEVLGVVFEK